MRPKNRNPKNQCILLFKGDTKFRKLLFLIFFSAIVLVLSACKVGPQPPEPVEITLTEFGIQSSSTTFKVGEAYRFVITNAGSVDHEFSIMPPGPTVVEMEGMAHNMEGAIVHIGQEELVPGTTVTVEYTFTQLASLGVIEFACHLPGHYESGMHTPISVEA